MNIMKNPKTSLYAKNGKYGLEIYIDISGTAHHLSTRRPSGLLYLWLKDGKSLDEIRRTKPRYTRAKQKRHHYAQYLLKLVAEYVEHELVP